jgi:hypothetical protein
MRRNAGLAPKIGGRGAKAHDISLDGSLHDSDKFILEIGS